MGFNIHVTFAFEMNLLCTVGLTCETNGKKVVVLDRAMSHFSWSHSVQGQQHHGAAHLQVPVLSNRTFGRALLAPLQGVRGILYGTQVDPDSRPELKFNVTLSPEHRAVSPFRHCIIPKMFKHSKARRATRKPRMQHSRVCTSMLPFGSSAGDSR